MERNEEDTLQRVADGDLVELEILCRRHTPRLCNFAYRLLWNWADAEEVVQETLFRTFKLALAGQFQEGPHTFRASVYTIARNLCLDRMGERQPSPRLDDSDAGTEPTEGIDDALAKLNANHRTALLLRDYSGLDYAEIARVLNCAMSQVKTFVYQGRREVADLVLDGE